MKTFGIRSAISQYYWIRLGHYTPSPKHSEYKTFPRALQMLCGICCIYSNEIMDRDIVGEGTKSNADEFSPKTWSVETTQQRMQIFQEHPSKSQETWHELQRYISCATDADIAIVEQRQPFSSSSVLSLSREVTRTTQFESLACLVTLRQNRLQIIPTPKFKLACNPDLITKDAVKLG